MDRTRLLRLYRATMYLSRNISQRTERAEAVVETRRTFREMLPTVNQEDSAAVYSFLRDADIRLEFLRMRTSKAVQRRLEKKQGAHTTAYTTIDCGEVRGDGASDEGVIVVDAERTEQDNSYLVSDRVQSFKYDRKSGKITRESAEREGHSAVQEQGVDPLHLKRHEYLLRRMNFLERPPVR
eukprot:TRINITY_DN663_c0_g1_i1.p1 TRINITY_DN663_c0_g1~~TRINITY_DN663_c0_g1_i1.p1  ORF type:complete len:182 (+),score=69.45 TRINITY_DN663_c0_g1_i1:90-635(+)